MQKVTLIRYGELALKSDSVRKRFEQRLIWNIEKGLKDAGFSFRVKGVYGRLVIEGYDKGIDIMLKKVFGLVSFSAAVKIESDFEQIRKTALEEAKKAISKSDSFAVQANRLGKHNFNSKKIEIDAGSDIVKAIGAKVNLGNPQKIVGIDVRDRDAYIFTETVDCQGGLPLGAQGKVLGIISCFEDVIACWLFMKRGCFVYPAFYKISGKEKDVYKKLLEKWSVGLQLKDYTAESIKEIKEIAERNGLESCVSGKSIDIGLVQFNPLVGFGSEDMEKLKKVIEDG